MPPNASEEPGWPRVFGFTLGSVGSFSALSGVELELNYSYSGSSPPSVAFGFSRLGSGGCHGWMR